MLSGIEVYCIALEHSLDSTDNETNAAGSNSTNIDGITCFVCGLDDGSPAKQLSDCTNIQKCRPGEFCYLEHIYDIGKRTDYYVGGCRAPETCHLQTCLKDQYNRREDHTKLVHCSECCSSSYCNGKLCNYENHTKIIVPPAKFTCPLIPTTVSPTTLTSTMTTTPTTTAIPTTTKHTTGQCRDRPGVSCTELMSINICSSLIADKYCAKSGNHCINTGHIMTPDPVITGQILTPDPVITGNLLTPDPDKILGKK
ncbi:unnamed protein product [Mytilus coruscus]|uniref:Uncharacterized protein n=1 Tax=Mytilus coruscus TaxID=42192 RepID=A0A6J8BIZ3_MYTCO|nr:unnamed protein product [Mytilus coruscus]